MSAQPAQFDSHRFVKRLTNAGISEEVAEILAEEHASLILPADVATKSDVAAVNSDVTAVSSDVTAVRLEVAEAKATTEARIAEARTATEKRIAEAENRIRASVRDDILTAEARSRAEFTTAMADLKDAIADYKTSTLKWMFGMMTAYTGVVMTAVVTLIVSLK